ncbi:unnamed protein product, partial [Rotaria magnacalcarata]
TLRENRQKLWRQALESIGFGLVSNIKVTNLYCMAFRKITQQVKLNEDEHERISQLFNIPQDIMNDNESSKSEQKLISVDEDLFGELPFSFD